MILGGFLLIRINVILFLVGAIFCFFHETQAAHFTTKFGTTFEDIFLEYDHVGTHDPSDRASPIWYDEIKSIKELVDECLTPSSRAACLQANRGTTNRHLNLIKLAQRHCKTLSPQARLFTEKEYDRIITLGAIDHLPAAKTKVNGSWIGFLSETTSRVEDGIPLQVIFGGESKSETPSEVKVSENQNKIKFEIPLGVRCVISKSVGMLTEGSTASYIPWVNIGTERDGIQVSSRKMIGQSTYAFRGEGIVPAPVLKMASILTRYEEYDQWVDQMKRSSFRILHQESITNFIGYFLVKPPAIPFADWIVSNRDFEIQYDLQVESKDKIILKMNSTPDDAVASPDGVVRGTIFDSTYIVTSQSKEMSRVIVEINMTPNGSLPRTVVEYFQAEWPYKTLMALRRQAEARDHVISDELKRRLK